LNRIVNTDGEHYALKAEPARCERAVSNASKPTSANKCIPAAKQLVESSD
jgi:hypothetical protein